MRNSCFAGAHQVLPGVWFVVETSDESAGPVGESRRQAVEVLGGAAGQLGCWSFSRAW